MRQPDLPVCVDCHENAVFTWDEFEGTYLSECCGAPAMPVDVAPWVEDELDLNDYDDDMDLLYDNDLDPEDLDK